MINIIRMILIMALALLIYSCEDKSETGITKKHVRHAESIIGLEYTELERDSLLEELTDNLKNYRSIEEVKIDNSVPPALQFNPIPVGFMPPTGKSTFVLSDQQSVMQREIYLHVISG